VAQEQPRQGQQQQVAQLLVEENERQWQQAEYEHQVPGSHVGSSSAGTAVQTQQWNSQPQPQPQPQLQYKLLLHSAPHGWYTAEYVPFASETAAQADPLLAAAVTAGRAGPDADSAEERGEVGVDSGSFPGSGGSIGSAAGGPWDGCSSNNASSRYGQHSASCDESDKAAFLQLFPDR
jgi:hypothetical protein